MTLRSLFSSLVVLASASTVAACNGSVTWGGSGTADDDACLDCGQGGSGAGNTGPIVSDTGVAIRYDDLMATFEPPPPEGSSGSGGDPLPFDPDTLVLVFGSEPVACAAPTGLGESCPPAEWKVHIPLSVQNQHPGTYLLADLVEEGVAGGPYMEEQGQNQDAADCWWGAGTFFGGTLEVISIDDAQVTFRLSGSDKPEADGVRTVPICGGGAPQATNAIAMTEAQLDATYPPTPSGSSSSGGEPPPSDRLFVFIDQSPTPAGLVCSDPYGYDAMCTTERNVLIVSLTPDLLTPGVYPMSNPGISVGTSETGPSDGTGECWGGGSGGWTDGTVEVVAVDGASIELVVSGGPVVTAHATASLCGG
jgi:hypothetical protein